MFRRRRVTQEVVPAPPAREGVEVLVANSDVAVQEAPVAASPTPASPDALDDEMLVRRAQAGDLDAFNQLVVRHERPVFNVALRLLRDVGLAEDATQDAFIRAWQNIGSFQTGSFRSCRRRSSQALRPWPWPRQSPPLRPGRPLPGGPSPGMRSGS